ARKCSNGAMTRRLCTFLAIVGLIGLASVGTAPGPLAAQEVTPADATTPAAPGLVLGWGSNASNQLGVNGPGCSGTPTACPSPYSGMGRFGILQAAMGAYHSIYLRADGTVWT